MEWIARLHDIERRAGLVNMTLHELCVEAAVPHTTVWRLRQPDADPRVKTLKRVLEPLEKLLDKKEAALRRALACRRGSPRPAA